MGTLDKLDQTGTIETSNILTVITWTVLPTTLISSKSLEKFDTLITA